MGIGYNIANIRRELPPGVKLVAVSKFHPIEAVGEAYTCGQRLFGESRPQELALKAAALPSDIEWHFIGHLQKNKLKMVLPYAAVVESVDSVDLLDSIEAWATAHPGFRKMGTDIFGETDGAKVQEGDNIAEADKVSVLLELHIAGEESKQGFTPDEALSVLTGPARWPHIRFCGLMGMATNTDDESVIRGDFGKLIALNAALRPLEGICPNITPDFRELSFGMSDDYRIAVSMGATLVRIGTAIFGARNY